MTTPDSNLAAFLVFKGLKFSYQTEDTTGRMRVFFTFPDVTWPEEQALTEEFLNSDMQRFCDAQRRIKNVIRNLAR
jgi:hypothetical protein